MKRSVVLATTVSMLLALSPVFGAEGPAAYQVASANVNIAISPVREVYAYPNPARGSSTVTFHAEVANAAGVEVSVYNTSGELVHQGQISGDGSLINGAPTYEYRWNTGNVASGCYFIVVKAQGVDGQDVYARKAFTVIN
ncbi:MAG: T9SS type A sorting domain-containing protein [Elusimicrobia bacterium]|nr:T9SS type A sorting domain-containing protein [Elusimicrobiota bacterium]